jgi:hypothetical protein
MNRRAIALTVAGVAMLASATPALATTPSESHPVSLHAQVLQLHVTPVSFIDTSPGYVASDDDYDANGIKVGSDVTTCRPVPGNDDTARCDVGLGLSGGLITITFNESDASATAFGRVTGGTGIYAGARGPVVIDEGDNGADVTLTLHR